MQVCALDEQNQAAQFVRELRAADHSAWLQELSRGEAKLYRVLVGPFDSHEQANGQLTTLKRYPLTSRSPFVRRFD